MAVGNDIGEGGGRVDWLMKTSGRLDSRAASGLSAQTRRRTRLWREMGAALAGFAITAATATAMPPSLRVNGNHLETDRGETVRLQGVNIPGLEWDPAGDHLQPTLEAALGPWHARVIRLPLSQDTWFGYFQGGHSTERRDAYRQLVDRVVRTIADKDAYVLLDLHWSDGGVWGQNVGQHALPDDHSLRFWEDVAGRFANNPAVFFDLYNEPHDVSWELWRNGGMVEERNQDPARGLKLTYHSPGMQALVNTVRSAGARNVVVAGGLNWAYDLRGILQGHALTDLPGRGIVYATHLYPWKKDWDSNVTLVMAKYAVFVGEVGTKPWKTGEPAHENVYTESWAPQVMAYLETHQLSWTAWSFHPGASPCLINGWDYTPTAYWGSYVKEALAKAAAGAGKGPPSPRP